MSEISQYTILNKIQAPSEVKHLSEKELDLLCTELRAYIVDVVSRKGGHLSSSLGVVELTVALLHQYDFSNDSLIWDVGHQAYGYKILTGRQDQFETIRQFGGISGFPKMSESKYDHFGTGHASTSISAALGMALADKIKGEKHHRVAVIGDGALTGGMAFEAMNHAGHEGVNLTIIINDNNVSIDENVGGLKKHLESLKSPLNSNFFENLGMSYSGPVDGHNAHLLIEKLQELKSKQGVQVLHCITKKGKGYEPAETGDAITWHAPGVFDKETGKLEIKSDANETKIKFQHVFGESLVELGKINSQIVGITPAMPSGSSMNLFMNAFPERSFDVGIAEEHAVTLSAGLASQGLIPFCNIYSTFAQRAYDQIIHDVAIQNLKVIFCLDRAGLVGADGPTHHGAFDIAFLRCIPNMTILSPRNASELRNMMFTAQSDEMKGPVVIRYPRGYTNGANWKNRFQPVSLQSEWLQKGEKLGVISVGAISDEVSQGINHLSFGNEISHLDLKVIKPLDTKTLTEFFKIHQHVIVIEDAAKQGSAGSALIELKESLGISTRITQLGIPDEFIEHGSTRQLHKKINLDASSIASRLTDLYNSLD